MAEQPETTETRLIFATGTVPSPLGQFISTCRSQSKPPKNQRKHQTMSKNNSLKRRLEGKTMTRDARQSVAVELARIFDEARHSMPKNQHVVADDFVRFDSRRSSLAGVNASLSLRAMLPSLIETDGLIYSAPAPSAPAGEQHALDMALMQNRPA